MKRKTKDKLGYAHLDAISDEQFAKEIGDRFCTAAEQEGLTPKELFKMIIPEKPIPLSKKELEYAMKVANRLGGLVRCACTMRKQKRSNTE